MQHFLISIIKKIAKPFFGHQFRRYHFFRFVFNLYIYTAKKMNLWGTVDGCKFYIDSKTALGLVAHDKKAPSELRVLQEHIHKGDIVLDLGANIGYHTVASAKLVGDRGLVYSFEPDVDNFHALKRNIRLNALHNVMLEQLATSNECGEHVFYLDKNDFSTHTMYYSADIKRSCTKVKTVKLDDYFKRNNRIDFVKIDIEGSEYNAIMGMNSILNENRNLKIFTEFNPWLLQNAGIHPNDYLRLLLAHGFKLYDINKQGEGHGVVSLGELIKKYRYDYTNLLCIR